MNISNPIRALLLALCVIIGVCTLPAFSALGPQDIGGRVMDDAGQPIEGAHVEIWIRSNSHGNSRNGSIKTRNDGTWTFGGVAKDDAVVQVGAWDYRYAMGDYYDMKQMTAKDLRDGSFTVTLQRGQNIDCTVTKDDGTPLPGASVKFGGTFASNTLPARKTGPDGKVSYIARPGDQVVLTVTCPGFAPELTQFSMSANNNPVSIKLQKSTPLVGHVVDPDGKPVPNAWIFADTWRGVRSLEVRIQADRDGQFVWNDPPNDDVLCDVDATQQGFIRQQNVRMSVADPQIVITVQRALKVTGTVVDAETNQPIDSFQIIRGISFGNQQPINWMRDQKEKGKAGKFQITENWAYPGYAIRINAVGYLPADSRVYTSDEKQISLEIKLKKGAGISGVVLNADGKPAAGVKIYLVEAGNQIQIANGRLSYERGETTATTAADGKYTFPPQTGDFKLVALADDAYADVDSTDLPKDGQIHLAAWGAIHGKLMKGTKPWPAQTIMANISINTLYDQKKAHAFYQLTATTDDKGEFTVTHVPPGKGQVSREVLQAMNGYRMNAMTAAVPVTVAAGKTSEVKMGGNGRPVEGRAIIPQLTAGTWNIIGQIQTTRPRMEVPLPDAVKKAGGEEVRKWYENFIKSAEGKTFQEERQKAFQAMKTFPLVIGSDGKFHADDVSPGKYELTVNIAENTQDGQPFGSDIIARGQTECVVPEIPGGVSDEPMIVPDVPLQVLPRVAVGEPSPDYGAKTLDGKNLQMSSFAGKYLLIELFHASMPVESNELESIKSAATAFVGDDRFAMLGIAAYGSPEQMKNYSQTNGLTWTAATIEVKDPQKTPLSITRFPTIWLVGPDGKVIAKNLHGDAIKSELTKALGPQGM